MRFFDSPLLVSLASSEPSFSSSESDESLPDEESESELEEEEPDSSFFTSSTLAFLASGFSSSLSLSLKSSGGRAEV